MTLATGKRQRNRPLAGSVPARNTAGAQGLRARRGLTLLELLLVLVVVVAVLALAWPALDRPFANQRLRRSADQVRAALARARNRAMLQGVPYEFRFVPGGSEFQVRPYEAMAENASTPSSAASGDAAVKPASVQTGVLPGDVYFASASAPANAGTSGATPSDVHVVQADGWSLPILLFPDGTATSAAITLVSDSGRMIDLHLRGLSGTARASEPYAAEGGG